MEKFHPATIDRLAFASINQSGMGGDMDRYIYGTMTGEGLGSLFGSIFRKAVPMVSKAIKGAATVAKPHLVKAGKDLIKAGAKRGFEELSKRGEEKIKATHRPHKRRKWKNL